MQSAAVQYVDMKRLSEGTTLLYGTVVRYRTVWARILHANFCEIEIRRTPDWRIRRRQIWCPPELADRTAALGGHTFFFRCWVLSQSFWLTKMRTMDAVERSPH